MQKRKIVPILCTLCLLFNLFLPMFKVKVYAADKNEVSLNFIGGTVQEGKVIYKDDAESVQGKIELVTLSAEKNDEEISITENNMKIDLNEKDYYLKVTSSILVENPDEILGTTGIINFNKLYIGETSFDTTSNQYVKLDTNEFSGNLNIKLEREPSPPTPSYPDNISIQASYDGFGMEIYLNSERIGAESKQITGIGKGFASGDISNLIAIQLAFGDGNIGSVTVNDKKINIPEGTKDRLEFSIEPASEYIIVVKKSTDVSKTPRTIIWDSDKKNNTSLKDNELLKNGTIEILDIKDPSGNSIGLENVKQSVEKNNGWASIIPGSKVILRLKPNYGYQLTSITINDEKLTAGEEQSTFEYIMPDTNVHFSGIFEKVDDEVKTESEKVKDGTISLGGAEIDSGSVILSVKDTDLSDSQISNFEEKSGEYKISSYLNISLNQVLYKGTASDVWSKELKELNNQATISLNLEETMDGNEVAVVHEKNDGTYEVIPTVYDSSSNTITFKTSSFSNYAIASKKVPEKQQEEQSEEQSDEQNNESVPQTGDNVIKYVLLITLAILLLTAVIVFNRRKKSRNK